MCEGNAPQLEDPKSHVGRWMDNLRPGHERVKDIEDIDERTTALEKENVLVSLENLLTFPYVAERVEAGTLKLHGTWFAISEGELHVMDDETGEFAPA